MSENRETVIALIALAAGIGLGWLVFAKSSNEDDQLRKTDGEIQTHLDELVNQQAPMKQKVAELDEALEAIPLGDDVLYDRLIKALQQRAIKLIKPPPCWEIAQCRRVVTTVM